MGALVSERLITAQKGSRALLDEYEIDIAANVKCFAGGLMVLDAAGNVRPGYSALGLVAVGRCEETKDNSGGAAGALKVRVRAGCFYLANSASTDALTSADVGSECYIVDDQTVARTSGGTRSRAGVVVEVDAGGVWVAVAPIARQNPFDLELIAAADLSAKQYYFVKVDSAGKAALAGAGEMAIGVLQNAPANGAVAKIRTFGLTRLIAGAAIAQGDALASDGSAKAKAAVKGKTDTSDAGSANDPLIGSHITGVALTAAAGVDVPFSAFLFHAGAIATTAA